MILAGVKSVTLYDPNPTLLTDLSSQVSATEIKSSFTCQSQMWVNRETRLVALV